jgi:hypothetical protein
MSRHRLPPAVAAVTGADTKNPQRYRNRTPPTSTPLGPPPDNFTEAERIVWAELADEMPWLAKSDRRIVALASRLQASIDADPATFPIGGYAQLRLCLAAMGGTPCDKTKVSTPADDDPDDPAAEFVN